MKKWWNDPKTIDAFLSGKLPAFLRHAFRQKLSNDPHLKADFQNQQIVYEVAHWYGRKKVRKSLQKINHHLLYKETDSALVNEVNRIFGKQ